MMIAAAAARVAARGAPRGRAEGALAAGSHALAVSPREVPALGGGGGLRRPQSRHYAKRMSAGQRKRASQGAAGDEGDAGGKGEGGDDDGEGGAYAGGAAGSPPPRFLVDAGASPWARGGQVVMSREESWHLFGSLRLRVGDMVEVTDGCGCVGRGSVAGEEGGRAVVTLGDVRRGAARPEGLMARLVVAVAMGGLKGGRGEWLVEKATELGVETIQPLETARAGAVTAGKLGRWARVSDAAVKQCLTSYRPTVAAPVDVGGLVDKIKGAATRGPLLVLVAHPTGGRRAAEALAEYRALCLSREEAGAGQELRELECPEQQGQAVQPALPTVWLVVGPEGDFTEAELGVLGETPHAEIVGLGSRRLRTETAAVALLSIASSTMEDATA